MRRRLILGALVLALLLGLCPAALAADVTFVAVNDDLKDLDLYTPVTSGGTTYVPGAIFAGELGIVFSHNVASKTASLYTTARTLYFDLTDFFAYDTQGNFYELGALLRDGRVYVPLDFLCGYFGLSYTWTEVEYGLLFRLKNSSAVLTDAVFVSAAGQSMRRRYNAWLEANNPATGTQPLQPNDPVTQPEQPSLMAVRLALVGPLDENTAALLDTLDSLQISCAFFTDAASLTAQPELVRRLLGAGYALGADAAGAEEAAAFNEALDAVALTRTRLVRCEEPEAAEALVQAGWVLCGADVAPALDAEAPPSSHQTALSLRQTAEAAKRTVALALPATADAGSYVSQLAIELGSSCVWEATNEVTAGGSRTTTLSGE